MSRPIFLVDILIKGETTRIFVESFLAVCFDSPYVTVLFIGIFIHRL